MDEKVLQVKGETDRFLPGAAPRTTAFFFYYGKNGQGGGRGRRQRDPRKHEGRYCRDKDAGGSSGDWDCEKGLRRQQDLYHTHNERD